MHSLDLYAKYRRRIEELADERRSTEHSLTALRDVLREFERESAALTPGAAQFARDEIANQLEHEALHATSTLRRAILLAAVKGFDGMLLGSQKT